MNFIDYLIATKNYSALSAVNDYTKVFGRTHPEITNPMVRRSMLKDLVSHRGLSPVVNNNFLNTNGVNYKDRQDMYNDPNHPYYNQLPDNEYDKEWVRNMWKNKK